MNQTNNFNLTAEDKLNRYLYTNNCCGAFMTSNRKPGDIVENVIEQLVTEEDAVEFLRIVRSASAKLLHHEQRTNISLVLASALTLKTLPPKAKLAIRNAVLAVCQSDADFFAFIRFYSVKQHTARSGGTGTSKLSGGILKLVRNFYRNKDAVELAECITRTESWHSWQHRDLMKLAHVSFKSDTLKEACVIYALDRQLKRIDVAEHKDEIVIQLLCKSYELKTTQDADKAVLLIGELKANYRQVNPVLLSTQPTKLWPALIPFMALRELLVWLPKFYKLNLLKSASESLKQLTQMLTDPSQIEKARLHPVEVYIYMKNFEKGGKPADPQLVEYLKKKQPKRRAIKQLTISHPALTTTLHTCLNSSYGNVAPLEQRIMITVDGLSKKMTGACFHCKNLTGVEAAFVMIKFFSTIEKQQNLSVGLFKNDAVVAIDVQSHDFTAKSLSERIAELKSRYSLPSASIASALMNKQPVDVFVNILTNQCCVAVPAEVPAAEQQPPTPRPCDVLTKYRRTMNLPETKLVNIYLMSHDAVGTDASRNTLDIWGFSPEVPRILEAYCRNSFC